MSKTVSMTPLQVEDIIRPWASVEDVIERGENQVYHFSDYHYHPLFSTAHADNISLAQAEIAKSVNALSDHGNNHRDMDHMVVEGRFDKDVTNKYRLESRSLPYDESLEECTVDEVAMMLEETQRAAGHVLAKHNNRFVFHGGDNKQYHSHQMEIVREEAYRSSSILISLDALHDLVPGLTRHQEYLQRQESYCMGRRTMSHLNTATSVANTSGSTFSKMGANHTSRMKAYARQGDAKLKGVSDKKDFPRHSESFDVEDTSYVFIKPNHGETIEDMVSEYHSTGL